MSKEVSLEDLKKQKFLVELTGYEVQVLKEALDLTVRTRGIQASEPCLLTLISLNKAKNLITADSEEAPNLQIVPKDEGEPKEEKEE